MIKLVRSLRSVSAASERERDFTRMLTGYVKPLFAAAAAVRELTYEVESGKACAKAGPKKVKGVGKGIGDKIDEFLKTGTMERISELEAAEGTDAA